MVDEISFAIIIPVYNAKAYIAECLDSLLAQTYKNWMAYCVDDGSKDESYSIMEKYPKRDSRIKVYHKNNGGVASARNYALDRLGDEKWVSFVDADDFVPPYYLENIVKSIMESDKEFEYIRLFPKGTFKRYPELYKEGFNSNRSKSDRIVSSRDYFRHENVGGFVASLVIRKSIVEENRIRFNESMRILEDQVFSIHCASCSNNILIHNGNDYYYYSNPNSATKSSSDRSNDIIACINNVWRIFSQTNDAVLLNYYKESFIPVKVRMLLKERFKHVVSVPKSKLYSSFKIGDYKLSAIDIVKYYLLKAFNRL